MSNSRQHSKHFLARDRDGNVKLRMKFTGEEASLFEEAAGDTPIMLWMHRALKREARREVAKSRAELADLPPPVDQ